MTTHDVETPHGTARVHLDVPRRARALVVLGHGAGRGVDTDDLQALAEALPEHGVGVALVDQPWVLAGRRVAAPPAQLDAAWIAVLEGSPRLRSLRRRLPWVAGGRSAGARVACRTAARTGASAVLLLAFPLLPPSARAGGATRETALGIRLAELRMPAGAGLDVVVAQGERDPFGSGDDLAQVCGAEITVVPVPDADHSLRVRRGGPDPVPSLVVAALRAVASARGE
jgi:predicted alpha/beta-hydrolase family hydrolase